MNAMRTSNVECHLRRIDLMVRTIVYVSVNTQYRESAKDTGLRSLFDTFADCGDVLLRNRTADYSRLKLEGLLAVRHPSASKLTLQ